MPPSVVIILFLLLVLIWVGWRLASQRKVLPCPAEFSGLVELENPLARASCSEEVVRRLMIKPGQKIVDVGCGPGRVSIPLAEATGPDGEVFAVDLQESMLAKVRTKAEAKQLNNIRCLQMDPLTLKLEIEDADAVVMVMMLGEVPEASRLLSSVKQTLKPHGSLLIAESIFDPHYLRRKRLRTLLTDAGFVMRSESGNIFGYNMFFEKNQDD